MKKRKPVLRLLCLTAVMALILSGCGAARPSALDPLTVTLLKVGKADAIVLITGENVMVIDAGEEEDGLELVEFLQDKGIRRVDELIITHYDKDHVGGADTLVESMDIGRVLLPAYEGDSTEYSDFIRALEEKDITPLKLTEPMEFSLGDCQVLVEPPVSYETDGAAEFDNNFSLITTVTHGANRLVFTGDIEKQRIRQWLEDGSAGICDFLKVPHHGVYNKALDELFDALAPRYAAICSSAKNPADDRTLELLAARNTDVMQTKDGDITVISDGRALEMSQRLS